MSIDALVVFTPSGRRGRFPVGTPVIDAARALGVYVESVCGGRGICGRCQVVPTYGAFAKHAIASDASHLSAVNEVETRFAGKRGLAADRRLSCQARVNGDVVIDVPADAARDSQLVRKPAEALEITPNPTVRLHTLTLPAADMEQPLGAFDRLCAAFAVTGVCASMRADLHVLEALTGALERGNRTVTMAVHDDGGTVEAIAIWPGVHEVALGIACDIGSTTIACHLIDLVSGRTLATAGTSNPQIRFGEDLMSRVSYVMMNPDGRPALTRAVRDAVGALVARVTEDAGCSTFDILDAVLVGNPVMHHLFLGLDPTPLGQAPFELAVSSAVTLRAHEVDLKLHAGARVYVLPCIAGHVGADAAAVALATAPQSRDGVTLVVDVGTNAEIILADRTRILAASSPTGPAFEGAQIGAGQRAAPGAIERVRIDRATLEPRIRIIGSDHWSDEPGFAEDAARLGVTGICGSGIIEALGEMFLAGILAADGTVVGAARSPRIVAEGRTFAYRLWDGPVEIMISQADVRAIQLAKGALYAGARLLMERMEIGAVDRIELAGAFGSHIDPMYAVLIGLVPDCDLDRVVAVGNAAGTGARMCLLDRNHRRTVEALVRRMEKIETALEPRFQSLFVSAMAFPNAEDAFPNLAAAVALPAAPAAVAGPRRRRRAREEQPE